MFVLKIALIIITLIVIFYVIRHLVRKYQDYSVNSPYIMDKTKNGKHALVISQDPESVNYIPIQRSEDRENGIEFTYDYWMLIENFDYKQGEWKHLFHKGNSSSYPNRAPGVWLHPTKNIMRVYMNTQDNILEYVDIDNLPLRKWIHVSLILKNKSLDIYINGYLKSRKEFDSLPKQNSGDFWINMFGGFEGYLSNIRYYSYAVDFTEIDNNIKKGPNSGTCIDTNEIPPYLDDNWWYS
jgi:hypothetical protein